MTEVPPATESARLTKAITAARSINFSPVEINSETIKKKTDKTTIRLASSKALFHKFIILGGSRYYKDFVLKLVIEAAHPNELIPVKYQKQDPDSFFYARACGQAIDKFCRDGLIVVNPHGENMQMKIILAEMLGTDCEVNINSVLSNVLKKRYNAEQSSLNLKDFNNDPELVDALFVPLSQPRTFEFVMSVLKRTMISNHRITSISLANNELSVMKTLEHLPSVYLRTLNLSYNKFNVVEDLALFPSAQLVEINLDNNPLCQQFDDEMTYIEKIREFLPTLTILDGVTVNDQGIPHTKRNFLIKGDGGPLVDQFLQHYFDTYDSTNRRKLTGTYHAEAQFSLTVTYLPKQTTSATSQLMKYLEHNRNLMKMSNYAKAHQLLFQGQQKIIELLCLLPVTLHDPHSFSVDLPFYTDDMALINVTGVFKDSGLIRSFYRTFFLRRMAKTLVSQEWQIVNEMLHVSNALSAEASEAFRIERAPRTAQTVVPQLDEAEQAQMTEIVAQITEMKPEYAQKSLEDCDWNLEEALTVFRDLYKLKAIPNSAFQGQPD